MEDIIYYKCKCGKTHEILPNYAKYVVEYLDAAKKQDVKATVACPNKKELAIPIRKIYSDYLKEQAKEQAKKTTDMDIRHAQLTDEEVQNAALFDDARQNEDLQILVCYDNGGDSVDRYTIVMTESYEDDHGRMVHMCLNLSEDPTRYMGVSMWGECFLPVGKEMYLGWEVKFEDLPEDIQTHVKERMVENE